MAEINQPKINDIPEEQTTGLNTPVSSVPESIVEQPPVQ
tara:strand:+ start:5531 stop:5647 length:117 start_codon:yes stop_codon:yes gene_type:complete